MFLYLLLFISVFVGNTQSSSSNVTFLNKNLNDRIISNKSLNNNSLYKEYNTLIRKNQAGEDDDEVVDEYTVFLLLFFIFV